MESRSAYAVVSATYGAFTLTDGALRTLVLLYLHGLGYTPLELATLFMLYEFFGVVTNLYGGWLGARYGLNATLASGLVLQVLACATLALRADALSVGLVMACQGLSGIAKDLVKMSSKSFVKLLVPEDDGAGLLRWVALITGSKNTLKGVGYLLGGVALATVGFSAACAAMAAVAAIALLASIPSLPRAPRKASGLPLRSLLSDDPRIHWLAAARFFLFGSRDLWFAVALPVFLAASLGWSVSQVSAFLALWIVGYGGVQALAPKLVRRPGAQPRAAAQVRFWTAALVLPLGGLAAAIHFGVPLGPALTLGLALFGVAFAIDSALHSFLIVAYAESESVALRVGFYYMANAGGRLIGILLSGALFQAAGLGEAGFLACIAASALFVLSSALLCTPLGRAERAVAAH